MKIPLYYKTQYERVVFSIYIKLETKESQRTAAITLPFNPLRFPENSL